MNNEHRALRVVFAGTPEFAAVALRALLATRHQVVAVYTQPDRPAGRGRKLRPSPVKEVALEHELPVFQPTSLKPVGEQAVLAAFEADVMVVAAYGLLLPKAILETPRLGCLNIHGSLLPRWRGAAPIQRAILAGDTETGITIMQMDEGLDTGAMLLKRTTPIAPRDTAGTLHDRLAGAGAELCVEALDQLAEGSLIAEPQDDALATYASKLEKSEALVDWTEPAVAIDRKVRAFNPWPVAQTTHGETVLRIWEALPVEQHTEAAPGLVIAATAEGIDVATGSEVLRIKRLQKPGGKPLNAREFLNAYPLAGARLGNE